jgi:hypothetical protein
MEKNLYIIPVPWQKSIRLKKIRQRNYQHGQILLHIISTQAGVMKCGGAAQNFPMGFSPQLWVVMKGQLVNPELEKS